MPCTRTSFRLCTGTRMQILCSTQHHPAGCTIHHQQSCSLAALDMQQATATCTRPASYRRGTGDTHRHTGVGRRDVQQLPGSPRDRTALCAWAPHKEGALGVVVALPPAGCERGGVAHAQPLLTLQHVDQSAGVPARWLWPSALCGQCSSMVQWLLLRGSAWTSCLAQPGEQASSWTMHQPDGKNPRC